MSGRSRDIASALVAAILSQRLVPGTKLGERELAEIFGVSRIVVRQALIRVADEGLVTIEHNRGAFVAHLTPAQAMEIYEAMTLLEQGVAAQVISRTKGAHLSELRQQVELQKAALNDANLGHNNELGQEFHTLFIRLGHNRVVEEIHARLSRQAKLLRALYRSHFDTCVLVGDHLKLIEHMEKGRLAAAQALIAEHNRHVGRAYQLDLSDAQQIPLEIALAAYATPADDGEAEEAPPLGTRRIN